MRGQTLLTWTLDRGDNGDAVPSTSDLDIIPVGKSIAFDRLYFTEEGLNETKDTGDNYQDGVNYGGSGSLLGNASFGSCPTSTANHADGYSLTSGSVRVEPNGSFHSDNDNDPDTGTNTNFGKGEAAICFKIVDDNGASGNAADRNVLNYNFYRLVLTRK